MKLAQFVDRGILSIPLTLLLTHSLIAPGAAQVTGKNDCHRVDRQESTKIKSTNHRVIRQQTQLTIKTRQRLVVFQDICDAQIEQSTTYTLASYFADLDYFLVGKSAYEEGDYTLINGKTGAKTILWAPPVFAPNRKHFASMTIDELNGNTSVYIYQIDSTGVKVEYRDNNVKWKPTKPVWLNNNSIEFVHNPHAGKAMRVVLRKVGQGWVANYPKTSPDAK